jgi:hypothetical protein
LAYKDGFHPHEGPVEKHGSPVARDLLTLYVVVAEIRKKGRD